MSICPKNKSSKGRNLFQAENPGKITRAISEVVHNDLDVEEALKFLD